MFTFSFYRGIRGIFSPVGSSGLDLWFPNGSISTSAIFYSAFVKMTSYNIHPTVPEDPQVAYHLNRIQSKQQRLLKIEERYKEKYKKYTKILDRLTWLNACSSSLSIASGISSVATLSTFMGLPVSIPLGVISLTGARVSGLATALTKKYQKKLSKVMKLTDIITSAKAVFETSLSKSLSNGKIDEKELNVL